jgi:hypothetical protein
VAGAINLAFRSKKPGGCFLKFRAVGRYFGGALVKIWVVGRHGLELVRLVAGFFIVV